MARGRELDELLGWALSERQTDLRLLVGPAGCGKSWLARRLGELLAERGWRVDHGLGGADDTADALVIVEHALAVPAEVLRAALAAVGGRRRLLLIDREVDPPCDWWRDLRWPLPPTGLAPVAGLAPPEATDPAAARSAAEVARLSLSPARLLDHAGLDDETRRAVGAWPRLVAEAALLDGLGGLPEAERRALLGGGSVDALARCAEDCVPAGDRRALDWLIELVTAGHADELTTARALLRRVGLLGGVLPLLDALLARCVDRGLTADIQTRRWSALVDQCRDDEASEAIEAALAGHRDVGDRLALAGDLRLRAHGHMLRGRLDLAQIDLQAVIDALNEATEEGDPAAALAQSAAHGMVSTVLLSRMDADRAAAAVELAAALAQRGAVPWLASAPTLLASAEWHRAHVALHGADLVTALAALRRADGHQSNAGPGRRASALSSSQVQCDLAGVLCELDQIDEALAAAERALAEARREVAAYGPGYGCVLAAALLRRGECRAAQGRPAEALADAQQALDLCLPYAAAQPGAHGMVAVMARQHQATWLRANGDRRGAVLAADEAVLLASVRGLAQTAAAAGALSHRVTVWYGLVRGRRLRNAVAEAVDVWRRWAVTGSDCATASLIVMLGAQSALLSVGFRGRQAEAAAREAMALARAARARPLVGDLLPVALLRLANVLTIRQHRHEARALLGELAQRYRSLEPVGRPAYDCAQADAAVSAATLLWALRVPTVAVELLTLVAERLRDTPGGRALRVRALTDLARRLKALGRRAEAAAVRAELHGLTPGPH